MEDNRNPRFINWFAITVAASTIGTLCWLIYLSTLCNDGAVNSEKFKNFNTVFSSVLPVLATWMGTLLAYYFTKENFIAASEAQRDLIDKFTTSEQKLQSIKVAEVMILQAEMKTNAWKGAETEALPIDGFLKFFSENKINRMPILNPDGTLFRIVHESTFNEFLVRFIRSNQKPIADITVGDFFKSMQETAYQDQAAYVNNGAEFIARNCNLKDAQQKMEKNRNCQDVFITTTGDAKEKVLGWITNRIVEENARL